GRPGARGSRGNFVRNRRQEEGGSALPERTRASRGSPSFDGHDGGGGKCTLSNTCLENSTHCSIRVVDLTLPSARKRPKRRALNGFVVWVVCTVEAYSRLWGRQTVFLREKVNICPNCIPRILFPLCDKRLVLCGQLCESLKARLKQA
ncbi:unnamed protein product, partial [Ectocarpus sp. 12 AP-2014]